MKKLVLFILILLTFLTLVTILSQNSLVYGACTYDDTCGDVSCTGNCGGCAANAGEQSVPCRNDDDTCGTYGQCSTDCVGPCRVCTPGSYDTQCTGACGGCNADAGEQKYRQCNADGTAWGSWQSQCSTSCAGPCGGPCVEQVYQCNASGQWEYKYPQCSTIQRCGSCTNPSPPPPPPSIPPSPPPSSPPSCDNTALTITPNPANVGQIMYFKYNAGQDTNIGGDTWSPSGSVSGCYLDALANRQYICTAASATALNGGTWTHKWNNQSCSKTATYTINVPISAWIQVTGDVHSNTKINAPGGP